MSKIMSNPNVMGRPDWQPGHVPRLSYRNALPSGEPMAQNEAAMVSPPAGKPTRPGLSIREIREALPRVAPDTTTQSQTRPALSQMQKPKKSFLGGLFTKEPTLTALDQVAQQMIAQHGSISPKTIPHVSSQKMPEHVPKVNAKWDGVPEYVKMREKQDRDQGRSGRRDSLRPPITRSISTDLGDDSSVIRRRNSNAASTVESWDSRSSGSRPVFQDYNSMRPESLYSESSGTSMYPTRRSPSGLTPTCNTFNFAQTAESPVFWGEETPTPPSKPQRNRSSHSASAASIGSTDQCRYDHYGMPIAPSADIIPEYTSSTSTTPLERSPQTPSLLCDEESGLHPSLRQVPVLPASINSAKPAVLPAAGRVIPSEPNNTRKKNVRAGLGLQTNSVAPWESQTLPSASQTPQGELSSKSRGKGRLFGKERK